MEMDKTSLTQDELSYLQSLDPASRLMLEAKIIGFESLPPTIDEVLDDPYWLGDTELGGSVIYPYWREKLRELFPDPIHQHSEAFSVIFGGAIGTGKSTVVKVMALYTEIKLRHLKDLSFFGLLDRSKSTLLAFYHTDRDKCYSEFINPIAEVKKKSPYFKNNRSPHKIEYTHDTLRVNRVVGKNLVFCCFSEINFITPVPKLRKRLDTVCSRIKSRFEKGAGVLGMVVLDSSAKGSSSIVEKYIARGTYPYYLVRTRIWEIKAFLGIYSKDTFRVYVGDGVTSPFIFTGSESEDNLDQDRIIEVPVNLRSLYESDLELAIQDTAGYSTTGSHILFKNPLKVDEALVLTQKVPEIFSVDFFDESEIWDTVGPAILDELPPEKIIYVHIDNGISGDRCGIAIGYLMDEVCVDEALRLFHPVVSIPISFTLTRKRGQETAILKIFKFIIKLSTHFELGYVSMDTFQTWQLKQDLVRENIDAVFLSVDSSPVPYLYWKSSIYHDRFLGCNSKLLKSETKNLLAINGKIDHDSLHSKDCSDANAAVNYMIFKDIKRARRLSKKYQRFLWNSEADKDPMTRLSDFGN